MNITIFIKFISFITAAIFLLGVEKLIPERKEFHKQFRIVHNFTLVFINNMVMICFTFIIGFNLMSIADKLNIGILHIIDTSEAINIIISVIFLDMVIYFQHRCFHRFNLLWRLHAVHHFDMELDFSSGLRFHPIEIFISFFVKLMAITLIGASAKSVLIFELVLMISAMFNHSNLHLPNKIDRYLLRWIIVTPAMHSIHHSKQTNEMNSNFGFFLSVWDHLFKTNLWKRDASKAFSIGLNGVGLERQNILSMLAFPWKSK